MYVKPIARPAHLCQYEALQRRLRAGPVQEEIHSLLKRALAGYRGEQSMAYPLSYLDDKFSVFHNLRLSDHVHHFQIDFLILCSRFALILEVKNIAGKLTFDTGLHQLIRRSLNGTDIFDDPFTQANALMEALDGWLGEQGTQLPLVARVVVASAAELQATDHQHPDIQQLVRRACLRKELQQLDRNHTHEALSDNALRQLSDTLVAADEPWVINPFRSFALKPTDIMSGVYCLTCNKLNMIRDKRDWLCRSCGAKTKNLPALAAALQDYRLIFGSTITNKQCREFLQLDSDIAARRVLHTVAERYCGENKGRVYKLPTDCLSKIRNDRYN